MQISKIIIALVIAAGSLPVAVLAQSSTHNTCAAAFLDGKMVVEKYAPNVQAYVNKESRGTLTVNEVFLDENGGKALVQIPFQLGIKDSRTNSLVLLSEKKALEFDVRNILDQCQKGDRIVLLLPGNKWSLPHHELQVK